MHIRVGKLLAEKCVIVRSPFVVFRPDPAPSVHVLRPPTPASAPFAASVDKRHLIFPQPCVACRLPPPLRGGPVRVSVSGAVQ